MSAELKGNDRVSINIDCSGPIRGLVAEATAFGDVRGYLKRVPIPLDKPMESFDLAPFFGAGILAVTKHLQHAKQPFTGQVILKYGNKLYFVRFYIVKNLPDTGIPNSEFQFIAKVIPVNIQKYEV